MRNLKDRQERAKFLVEFKAYPKPDKSKFFWIIYDASDDETTKLKPGAYLWSLKILSFLLHQKPWGK